MGIVFVITSGKGGVGKTTTAINLAAAINYFKEDVTVIDANLTTPNIGIHLGAPVVPVSLTHVLQGKANVDEAIYEHESGIKILPCSLSIKELDKIKPEKLSEITKKLKKISNYTIMDSSGGLGEEALAAISASDEVIIVTNPEMPAVTDALKTAKMAESMKKLVRGVIITRVQKDGLDMPYANLKEMLELPILGIVPEDKSIRKSLIMKNSVIHTYPNSKSAQAYKEIAAKLLGKEVPRYSLMQRILNNLFG